MRTHHCWGARRGGKIGDMRLAVTRTDSAPIAPVVEPSPRAMALLRRWVAVLVLGLPLVAGGCAELIPKIELRDDYLFKRFLQPERVVSEVRRDEQGNPILPEGEQPK